MSSFSSLLQAEINSKKRKAENDGPASRPGKYVRKGDLMKQKKDQQNQERFEKQKQEQQKRRQQQEQERKEKEEKDKKEEETTLSWEEEKVVANPCGGGEERVEGIESTCHFLWRIRPGESEKAACSREIERN